MEKLLTIILKNFVLGRESCEKNTSLTLFECNIRFPHIYSQFNDQLSKSKYLKFKNLHHLKPKVPIYLDEVDSAGLMWLVISDVIDCRAANRYLNSYQKILKYMSYLYFRRKFFIIFT